MTNTDRLLAAITAHPGSTDAELRQASGIEPHQQVNQICRRLDQSGRILRRHRADGLLGNYPLITTSKVSSAAEGPSPPRRPVTTPRPGERETASIDSSSNPLLVIPCSGHKRKGSAPTRSRTVFDLLPAGLADNLAAARAAVALTAEIDESTLRPAWQRYAGAFYQPAGPTLSNIAAGDPPIIIVSGGYGLLLVDEAVGMYDRQFSVRDWPRGLLEGCLESLAATHGSGSMVAFLARSTGYADLLRQSRRRQPRLDVLLVTADNRGRGGAQRRVPHALGEAFSSFVNGTAVDDSWTSSDGTPLAIERPR